MFDHLFSVATQKLAILFVASLWGIGAFLASAGNHIPPGGGAARTAIIGTIAATGVANIAPRGNSTTVPTSTPWSVSSTLATAQLLNLPDLSLDLLPTSTAPFCTATSTCGAKALKKLVAMIRLVK